MSQSERSRPKSVAEIYLAFTVLALQGFGGVLAFIEREMVERRKWLSREEFIEDWAVARTMPGPPALNLSIMIGAQHFGLRFSACCPCLHCSSCCWRWPMGAMATTRR